MVSLFEQATYMPKKHMIFANATQRGKPYKPPTLKSLTSCLTLSTVYLGNDRSCIKLLPQNSKRRPAQPK